MEKPINWEWIFNLFLIRNMYWETWYYGVEVSLEPKNLRPTWEA